jgi:hypothetical protein
MEKKEVKGQKERKEKRMRDEETNGWKKKREK